MRKSPPWTITAPSGSRPNFSIPCNHKEKAPKYINMVITIFTMIKTLNAFVKFKYFKNIN